VFVPAASSAEYIRGGAAGDAIKPETTVDIFSEILAALETEPTVILATIVATTGSTPAAASSRMLIRKGGTMTLGTIGGGCMEGDVILHAHRIFGTQKPEILTFHLNEDDAEAGLICGGSLDVLLEPLSPDDRPLLRDLAARRERGEDCVLATYLPAGPATGWKEIIPAGTNPSATCTARLAPLAGQFDDELRRVFQKQESRRIPLPEGEVVLEPVAGMPPMFIFGGGHVSRAISRIADMAGFRVTVIDDREKYANPERFPEAVQTLVSDFSTAVTQLNISSSAYAVVVTRGHRYDEAVLEQVLGTPAKYVGMIGSRRKILTCYEHLRARGIGDDQLSRVHAPIGLDLGAVTAEEIAVSIVAECIHARRGTGRNPGHMKEAESRERRA
jgi:xanthine dehydrogenase accessory factor